ncbi:MAG: hypothetical protein EOO75_11320, partial [Myxococcales bacterium]
MSTALAPRLLATAVALAGALLTSDSQAQSGCPWGIPWCTVGPDGKVVVTPPPASTSTGGGVGAGAGAQHSGGVYAPAYNPQIELQMRARWDLYLKARADLRLQVRARVEAEVHEQWRQRWRQSPDPHAGRDYGGGGGSSADLGVPAFSFAPLCYGLWFGPVPSTYVGLCPFVRIGLTESLALEIGASVFVHDIQDGTYGSAHLHPALLWSFVEGTYASGKGAHGYLRAGLDAGLPWGADGRTPGLFTGAEVGIGFESLGGSVGAGVELRGQVRRGFAD